MAVDSRICSRMNFVVWRQTWKPGRWPVLSTRPRPPQTRVLPCPEKGATGFYERTVSCASTYKVYYRQRLTDTLALLNRCCHCQNGIVDVVLCPSLYKTIFTSSRRCRMSPTCFTSYFQPTAHLVLNIAVSEQYTFSTVSTPATVFVAQRVIIANIRVVHF